MSDKRLTPQDLSDDQREVFEAMQRWVARRGDISNNYELLTVGGLAGSGKSTLLGVFAASTELNVAYVSFTGRAASILKRKLEACGVKTTSLLKPPPELQSKHDAGRELSAKILATFDFSLKRHPKPFCGTIHRLLYRPVIDSKTEELTGWVKRDAFDRKYDLIVVDEASMVGDEMLSDLKIHNTPILAVGDHGQLPPVMSSGGLMQKPDLMLEKIHRQAADNPIIKLAHRIRETGVIDKKLADGKSIILVKRDDTSRLEEIFATARSSSQLGSPAALLDVGILCWMNRTRIRMNAHARRGAGFSGIPQKGEVVICLKNEAPIYNGMRGILTTDGEMQQWRVDCEIEFSEENLPASRFSLCAPQFNQERAFKNLDEVQAKVGKACFSMKAAGALFDFGSAMTVHKAQGSQLQHVVWYVDRQPEPNSDEWRKFGYTAVTRASDRLTIMI